MMVKIAVSDVEPGKLYERLDVSKSVPSLLAKRVEAFDIASKCMVSCDTRHQLVKAAHDAFYDHQPLTLRPDDIWFCVAQGFATHVNQNVEELRERFVEHQGKKKLIVERPDFFLGQPNPWPEAFAEFSDQIGEHVGKMKDLVCAEFSTTTPFEAAAFEVGLMDAFQGYFEYVMMCGCGIPQINLLGTAEDWAAMIPRIRHLSEYGLEFWADALVPVLEKIEASARGDVDQAFWQSFFRYQSGSGPAELTGWIMTLFPYLKADYQSEDLVKNDYLSNWRERIDIANARTGWRFTGEVQGPAINQIPQSLVSAPVLFVDMPTGKKDNLRFVSGMFGVDQDETTRALSPVFGWAVIYDDEPVYEHSRRQRAFDPGFVFRLGRGAEAGSGSLGTSIDVTDELQRSTIWQVYEQSGPSSSPND